MKPNLVVMSVMFSSLLGQLFICSPASSQTTENEARGFVEKWCAAFVENDADDMCELYLDSSRTPLIVSNGEKFVGLKNIRELYEESFQNLEITSASFTELNIASHQSSVFVSGRFQAKSKARAAGTMMLINCRTSLSLAKVADQWKIIGEHSSLLPGVERLQEIDN